MSTTQPEQALNPRTALELFSIAGSLNSTTDLDYLLQKIGAAAEKLLDSEASAIMLLTEDRQHLYFRVASGDKARAIKTMTLPIGQGISGWVAKNNKPEMVNDTRKDSRFTSRFDQASGFVTKSVLCVPMSFQGEIVGVAEVLNKRGSSYTDEDLTLLSSLASIASVAITNAKIISQQRNFFMHVLELLVSAIENARPRLEGHPMRAARLACAISRALGLDDYNYRMLYYAGLLHEIGHIALNNPRELSKLGVSSAPQADLPLLSASMLDGIKMLEGTLPIIRHYRELYDGSGFPEKLKGDRIPQGARILGLVESMEDLRMNRSAIGKDDLYEKALAEARVGSGKRFDPQIVDVFAELMAHPEGVW